MYVPVTVLSEENCSFFQFIQDFESTLQRQGGLISLSIRSLVTLAHRPPAL